MYTLLQLAVLTATVLGLAKFMPTVRVKSTGSAVAVAVVFSLLNWLVGWLIKGVVSFVLFLPAILTLGLLFLLVPFVVNAALLWATDKILHAFEIHDSKSLLAAAGVITLVNGAFHMLMR